MKITVLCALLVASIPCGSAQAATTWIAVNLHPAGAESSILLDATATEQVGSAKVGGTEHAALWRGTAASFVDLHPDGATRSTAWSTRLGEQAGRALFGATLRARIWAGTSASFRDLHPSDPAALSTEARSTTGSQQCGFLGTTATHAVVWGGRASSLIDLHPAAFINSLAHATNGFRQVGQVTVGSITHAALWSTSSSSFRDLNPAGATFSSARGIAPTAAPDAQIVGEAEFGGERHALLWFGGAERFVDLRPAGAVSSRATGTDGIRQVGHARFGTLDHAVIWHGSADSVVDLHRFLPAGFTSSEASTIWSDGTHAVVAGFATSAANGRPQAILWREATLPRPNLTLAGKPSRQTRRSHLVLRGTAAHAERVEVKTGTLSYAAARGTDPWSYRVRLRPGRNRVFVRALNTAGESSLPLRCRIDRL